MAQAVQLNAAAGKTETSGILRGWNQFDVDLWWEQGGALDVLGYFEDFLGGRDGVQIIGFQTVREYVKFQEG